MVGWVAPDCEPCPRPRRSPSCNSCAASAAARRRPVRVAGHPPPGSRARRRGDRRRRDPRGGAARLRAPATAGASRGPGPRRGVAAVPDVGDGAAACLAATRARRTDAPGRPRARFVSLLDVRSGRGSTLLRDGAASRSVAVSASRRSTQGHQGPRLPVPTMRAAAGSLRQPGRTRHHRRSAGGAWPGSDDCSCGFSIGGWAVKRVRRPPRTSG